MIIWLASHPKSGNTWIRSFLASILYSNEGNINFNDLKKLGGEYPLRSQFKNFVKDFNNIDEIKNAEKYLIAEGIPYSFVELE